MCNKSSYEWISNPRFCYTPIDSEPQNARLLRVLDPAFSSWLWAFIRSYRKPSIELEVSQGGGAFQIWLPQAFGLSHPENGSTIYLFVGGVIGGGACSDYYKSAINSV